MLGAKEVNGARFQTETLPKIDGRPVYLWRAVDAEGEVLDVLIQTRRNKRAALKLTRKLLKKYSFVAAKHQKTARYFSSEMMPMMITNTRVPCCRSSMGY
jgi:transposase-like protein